MARLTLKPGVSYFRVGETLAEMATSAKQNNVGVLEDQIREFTGLIDQGSESILPAGPCVLSDEDVPPTENNSVQIRFHIDRTVERTGHRVRIVNVVVPDFDGKLAQMLRDGIFDTVASDAADLKKAVVDLDAVAKEAFGFITICGCGN